VATSDHTHRRAHPLLVEGIVILASILVAFWLDGWRADREMDRDLTQELESVYREVQRNRDLVVAELVVLNRLTASADALLADLSASPRSSTMAVTDSIAWLATSWSATIDPSLGAVQAMIDSGRLAQVPNPQLRQGLAGLRDQFEDAVEEEVLAREVFSNQIFPLTRDRLDYQAFGALLPQLLGPASGGRLSQESLSKRSFPTQGTIEYPNSPAIRNALELRREWNVAAQDEMAQLKIVLNDLLTALEDELADR